MLNDEGSSCSRERKVGQVRVLDEARLNQKGWKKEEKVRLNKIGFLHGYI